jgi:hypothetical protein
MKITETTSKQKEVFTILLYFITYVFTFIGVIYTAYKLTTLI